MKSKLLLFLILLFSTALPAQNLLNGKVYEKLENGVQHPLAGANIYWLGTTVGTTSDLDGSFQLEHKSNSNILVVSFIGYTPDTLNITNQKYVEVFLSVDLEQISEVEVVDEKQSSYSDYFSVESKTIMTDKELYKAACCNLSESFETNPSIDVSFTDAITGVKQIEMLGLSGIYTQTTMENLPYIRGLLSGIGLTFVPGTWVQAINVSKGIGSVANGYESITGQIDVDLHKPFSDDEKPLLINIYGDIDKRVEGNLNFRTLINENVSAITLLHASTRQNQFDNNKDKFSDMPTFNTLNIMQRWQLVGLNGWESQLGFQFVNDEKEGGTFNPNDSNPTFTEYRYNNKNRLLNIYGKTGYVFPDNGFKTFGFQWSLTNYNSVSTFGNKYYSGNEKTGYFNFIYQSIIDSRTHKFRTGISFLFDQFNEQYNTTEFKRIERVPGTFFEYTYTKDETFSVIAGIRFDKHNFYDWMITPRLHIRYSPQEDWVFRAVAGRGYRTSNILIENNSVMASSRKVIINSNNNFGYGLGQEKAWNYGLNVTHYFYYDYREATISIDFYRTDFEQLTIADLDTNPQEVRFSTIPKGSYSNSVQTELNIQPFERFDFRLAYRYLDVKQKINGEFLERAFSAKNRLLVNFAYQTEKENEDDPQMMYDITLQWFDKKRIPSTSANPLGLQTNDYSPQFAIVNLQVTRTFYYGFDLYLGIENLFNFKQKDLIIDPANPYGEHFDASLIWGPVNGTMIYAGLRYKM